MASGVSVPTAADAIQSIVQQSPSTLTLAPCADIEVPGSFPVSGDVAALKSDRKDKKDKKIKKHKKAKHKEHKKDKSSKEKKHERKERKKDQRENIVIKELQRIAKP
jgi:mannitol-specific phosphotransferase system IIBC component